MIIDNRLAPGPSGDHPRDYFPPSRFDLYSPDKKRKNEVEITILGSPVPPLVKLIRFRTPSTIPTSSTLYLP